MSCRTITRPHVWVVCQCKREACRLVYCDVCGYDDRMPEPCPGEFNGEKEGDKRDASSATA